MTALSTLMIARWEEVAGKLAALAADFPAEKFEYPPVEGVRTFGDVLRHIAFWNEYIAEILGGHEADGSQNEFPLADYPTKVKIIEALAESSRKVVAALTDHPATAENVLPFIEHNCEHFGQLVVYSRLTGVKK